MPTRAPASAAAPAAGSDAAAAAGEGSMKLAKLRERLVKASPSGPASHPSIACLCFSSSHLLIFSWNALPMPCPRLPRANCPALGCTALYCPVPPHVPLLQVLVMELGSTHEPIIEVAHAGVLLALEHNMLPKPILQEALRWVGAWEAGRLRSSLLEGGFAGRITALPIAYAPYASPLVVLLPHSLQADSDRPGLLQSHQPAPAQAPAPPAGALLSTCVLGMLGCSLTGWLACTCNHAQPCP